MDTDKADRRRFVIDAQAYDEFDRQLEERPVNEDALRELLETPTVFDTK